MSPAAGELELDQALEALQIITQIRDNGRSAFDASEDRRLAAAFCWANVGSALKQFCRVRAIRQGTSPFPGPIRMRDKMLYQPVGDLSPEILWDTCVRELIHLSGFCATCDKHWKGSLEVLVACRKTVAVAGQVSDRPVNAQHHVPSPSTLHKPTSSGLPG